MPGSRHRVRLVGGTSGSPRPDDRRFDDLLTTRSHAIVIARRVTQHALRGAKLAKHAFVEPMVPHRVEPEHRPPGPGARPRLMPGHLLYHPAPQAEGSGLRRAWPPPRRLRKPAEPRADPGDENVLGSGAPTPRPPSTWSARIRSVSARGVDPRAGGGGCRLLLPRSPSGMVAHMHPPGSILLQDARNDRGRPEKMAAPRRHGAGPEGDGLRQGRGAATGTYGERQTRTATSGSCRS